MRAPPREAAADSLEEAFRRSLEDQNRAGLRLVAGVGGSALLLFSLVDYQFMSKTGTFDAERFQVALLLRVIAVAGQAWLFAASYSPRLRDSASRLAGLSLLIAMFPIAVITQLLGVASPYYAGLNLVMLASVFFALRPRLLVPTCGVIVASYVIPSAVHIIWPGARAFDDMPGFINNLGFLLTTSLFVIAANALAHKLRRSQFVAQHELRVAHEQLKSLDETRSRFFANISHELRTPLTLILSPLESLLENPSEAFDEGQREYLQTMRFNALRLLKLIEDLLDLAKLDDGQLRLRLQDFDLHALVAEVVRAAQPYARRKGVGLEIGAGDPLPVRADPDRTEQIALNLVSNALKFTPEGGTVTVFVGAEGDTAVVWVRDTGIGIAEEDQQRIFDRFAQADDAPTRAHEGTGIGLAVVRELLELQGGTIALESEPGVGSTFRFALPAGEVEAMRPTEPQRRTSARLGMRLLDLELRKTGTGPGKAPGYTLATATLLIVEDDDAILGLLARELGGEFRIVTAGDGAEGFQRALETRPDIVISDVMMPKLTGYEMCVKLKAHPATGHVPVLLLTAKGDLDSKLEGLDCGAEAYLPKPFSVKELRTRLHALLRSRSEQGSRLHRAKMTALASFAAGIAHEINNPLVPLASGFRSLLMFFDMYRERVGELLAEPDRRLGKLDERVDRFRRSVDVGIERIEGLVRKIARLAADNEDRVAELDLNGALESTIALLQPQLGAKVRLDTELCEEAVVRGPVDGVNQVLINLLQNALAAVGEEGTIQVRTWHEDGRVHLSVRDDGVGIPPDVQPRIFDHFFSTREEGKGMGLGLSIAHDIVTQMGGRIDVASRPGEGTAMTIRWPEPQEQPAEVHHV